MRYGEANEKNEIDFSFDVNMLLSQVEIYDQIWYVRHMSEGRKHSAEAIDLVRTIIERLKEIPDGCAEIFPFELIDELKEEYLEEWIFDEYEVYCNRWSRLFKDKKDYIWYDMYWL